MLETLAREGTDAPRDRNELLTKTAHSLAGAGGTFGFPGISERASHLEELLVRDADPAPADIGSALNALILEMKRVTS